MDGAGGKLRRGMGSAGRKSRRSFLCGGAEPLRPLRGYLPLKGRLLGACAARGKAPLKGELSPLGD